MCWEKVSCGSGSGYPISYDQWEENQFPAKYAGQPSIINSDFKMEIDHLRLKLECTLCTKEGKGQDVLLVFKICEYILACNCIHD